MLEAEGFLSERRLNWEEKGRRRKGERKEERQGGMEEKKKGKK